MKKFEFDLFWLIHTICLIFTSYLVFNEPHSFWTDLTIYMFLIFESICLFKIASESHLIKQIKRTFNIMSQLYGPMKANRLMLLKLF